MLSQRLLKKAIRIGRGVWWKLNWRAFVLRFLPAPIRRVRTVVKTGAYVRSDRSRVVLYSDRGDLFPGYEPRRRLDAGTQRTVQATLIATVKNEVDNVFEWLLSLEAQTRPPDEVVIVDGGSIDGTLDVLQDFAARHATWMKVIVEPGVSIARGRNLAVEAARYPIIASTDFGCKLAPGWLESLLAPFVQDPKTEVVAGWYEGLPATCGGRLACSELLPRLDQVHPRDFIPSARSMAYRKRAWELAGGYPEWLTRTGEDTYFALELKRLCKPWAFVPDAIVYWRGPESLLEYWQKLVSWARGDGESGVDAVNYWRRMVRLGISALALLGVSLWAALWIISAWWVSAVSLGAIALAVFRWIVRQRIKGLRQLWWVLAGQVARSVGFLQGLGRRPAAALLRYRDVRRVDFVMSGVAFDDTGGGSRAAQFAKELLRRGDLVVFVHKFPKYESIDLGIEVRHRNLLHYWLMDFHLRTFQWEYGALIDRLPTIGLVEFPLGDFLPLVEAIKKSGGIVVYDLLDDWTTSLGGEWYSPDVEKAIVDASDVLVATAPTLARRLARTSGRMPVLIPNAVDSALFDRRTGYERPADLPRGKPTILYVGALWGDWFNWDLVLRIARAYPRAAVVVIGDYRGQCPGCEPNLCFLGLKPQTSLPAYLAHADVAIVPWKVDPVTQATSPLKVYEYLAMGVPVVAPRLEAIVGLPNVHCAEDEEDFIRKVDRARHVSLDGEALDAFVRSNAWSARVDLLESAIEGVGQDVPTEHPEAREIEEQALDGDVGPTPMDSRRRRFRACNRDVSEL